MTQLSKTRKTLARKKNSTSQSPLHPKPKVINLFDSDYYFNREISALEFQAQVLAEAEDETHPLLERLKFLCILSSNLDEFFMIRVAALKEHIDAGIVEVTADEMTPRELLRAIRRRVQQLVTRQTKILIKTVLPELEEHGIYIRKYHEIHDFEKLHLRDNFINGMLPILTPFGLDSGHPFPQLHNRALNIIFSLEDTTNPDESPRAGVLQIPSSLPRLVQLHREDEHQYVLLEEIIQANADVLFNGMHVIDSYCFRVTRDADIEIAEDEASDLLTEIAEQTRKRRWGTDAVRLEIDSKMPEALSRMLMESLELEDSDVYAMNRPMNLVDFLTLMRIEKRKLKDAPFNSNIPSEFNNEEVSIFQSLKVRDTFLHHPYDSFSQTVVRYLTLAANDSAVVAIKITLYRAGGNSPVIEALKQAADNGKSVTAFVELKARFDEENNIVWAMELERRGVHVVYGILGLKTHVKTLMVVRRESNESLRTYTHLSTGNYNQSTARFYTDIGYFTGREDVARDAIRLFNYLTTNSQPPQYEQLYIAPNGLKQKVLELIERETANHTPETKGYIFAKMNSLVDSDVIRALYKASQKGVVIKLIIRGICCLKPGIQGVSENIEVRSIIGRFLEHSRILITGTGDKNEVYITSADWMPRNFDRRVEFMFKIPDSTHAQTLINIMNVYWSDNTKARVLKTDGTHQLLKPQRGEKSKTAQLIFLSTTKNARR